MKNKASTPSNDGKWVWAGSLIATAALATFTGCHGTPAKNANQNFFTSGSREADQRASQRMAQSEQLTGNGESSGEKGAKKAKAAKSETSGSAAGETNKAAKVENKLSLFERLGGETGVSNIVTDFTPRVLDDPR